MLHDENLSILAKFNWENTNGFLHLVANFCPGICHQDLAESKEKPFPQIKVSVAPFPDNHMILQLKVQLKVRGPTFKI